MRRAGEARLDLPKTWEHVKLLYTLEECETLLNLSRTQLYRLVDQGDLETVKIGKSRRVTHIQLDAFLEKLHQSGGFGVIH